MHLSPAICVPSPARCLCLAQCFNRQPFAQVLTVPCHIFYATQAYRDRKNKKREFRRLWITRINAGVREHGVRYSQFVNKLHSSGILLNRKILSDLAMNEPFAFKSVVDVVKLRAAEQYATDEFFNLVEEGEDEGTLIEEKK